ncbi:uncharacterized protein N7482_000894 [Penicillium canariense]|uniref:Uncharacterized protein n=1 Tax=Penicillium canariense TaxID=189055 RepID=A0A9W9IET4_9EURO|nr:uncharacterized protein N7482_000894 [Penicillium canariense]KAJ5175017.1 hypothetical protein N7482_000894 [Penicillium canariense]
MAKSTVGVIARRSSMFFLLNLMASLQPSHASTFDPLDLLPRGSSSCPSSYDTCGGSLPDTFCCPSSSICIGLDDASSAICCPSGASCDYISPIVCDVQEQNATAHPKNSVKTTKLDSSLPTCGDACCPFGYTCQGNSTCALNQKTSSTASSTSQASSTSTSTATDTTGATFTPVASPSSSASQDNSTTALASCPSFPSKAVVAGFFPGALFGAIFAVLIATCLRRRSHKKDLQNHDPKAGLHWSQRSSSGAVMGISSPIASEDNSYRTDFLLRPSSSRRTSTGGRSMLHRTGSRVKSLFSGQPRMDKDVPPVPDVHVQYPVTPPGQRQASTESIKVYSPPGAFSQSRKFLGPEPYPGTISRPDTTFTDLVQAVGFNDAKGNPSYKVRESPDKELRP